MARPRDDGASIAEELGPARTLAEAERAAERISLALASHFETTRSWPTQLLRTVRLNMLPDEFAGVRAPGQPDPRIVLDGTAAEIARYDADVAIWNVVNAAWHARRLKWLRSHARKEKK